MKIPYKKPLGLHDRAEAALAANNHSVFNPESFKVMDFIGNPVKNNWEGDPVQSATVHEPTTVTKAWRARFWPHKFHCMLGANMTREEAQAAADGMVDVLNMRRKGA